MTLRPFIVIDRRDNVATAVRDLDAGEELSIHPDAPSVSLRLTDPIPFGHKFSLGIISAGSPVIKYGETVGLATEDIPPGRHVHIHNVEGIKGRGDKVHASACAEACGAAPPARLSEDGKAL